MNRKRLTVLVSTVCALALLLVMVVPALASSPETPDSQFAAVIEQLTEEGVLNSEQAEIIIERTGPIFGKMMAVRHAYQQKVKEQAIARVKPVLSKISQALDMKPDELLPQLKEGKTIAQIAGERGVATDILVEELLEPVEARLDKAVDVGRLDQEQAEQKLGEARFRINAMIQNATPKGIVRNEVNRIRKQDERVKLTGILLQQVCQVLDLEHEELIVQLKEGKKIVEIAQEQGISREVLLDSLIESIQDRLTQAVDEGRLEEDKAADIAQRVAEQLDKFIDNFPPGQ